VSDKKAKKQAKGAAKDAKGKGKGKGAGAAGKVSVASHPRAQGQVRAIKGWGGLAAFAIAAVLSMRAGVPADLIGLRALIAGIAGYLVAWACAVSMWRAIVLAELHAQLERAARRELDSEGDG
jgi:uncharacterized oligopeptide transporter (OPT) family protein